MKEKYSDLQTHFSDNFLKQLGKHAIDLWIKSIANNTDSDILNSYDHSCPVCGHIRTWN